MPGFATGWRTLPWLNIQAVISGGYRLDHAGGSTPLPAGSVWFVPSGCRHRHAVVGDRPVQTAWWQGEVRLHGAIDAFGGCGAPRLLPGGLAGVIGRSLLACLAAGSDQDLASALDRQARATALAAALAAAVGGAGEAPAARALAPVFRFVEANLHLPLSRGELAERAGLSASRFHAVFLAATGEAPMSWVRRRRLALAAELLTSTRLGMAEIAGRVGLCDAYHLNKRFRVAHGLPPTAFRRQAAGG